MLETAHICVLCRRALGGNDILSAFLRTSQWYVFVQRTKSNVLLWLVCCSFVYLNLILVIVSALRNNPKAK